MEQEDKDTIGENFMYLCASLKKDLKGLVKHLKDRESITPKQAEDVMDEASDYLKAETLLEYLLKCGDEHAFGDFYEGCKNCQLWDSADIIKPENSPHKPKEEEHGDYLADAWPTKSHIDKIKNPTKDLLKRVGRDEVQTIGLYNEDLKTDNKSLTVYSMKHKIKGRMVIISNSKFKHKRTFPDILGSEYDVKGLDHLFSELGFEVRHEENITKKEMEGVLKNERNNVLTIEYSCFFFVVLSYGYKSKFLFGTDGELQPDGEPKEGTYLDIEDIKQDISEISNLALRPKVFFFDAQSAPGGYREEEPVETRYMEMHRNKTDHYSGIKRLDGPHCERLRPKLDSFMMKMSADYQHMDKRQSDITDSSGTGDKAPTEVALTQCDIFQASSTNSRRLISDRSSYGSWFIQTFIYVTNEFAREFDIQTLFEKVNNVYRDQFCNSILCETTSTLNKKLYFFPGLTHET